VVSTPAAGTRTAGSDVWQQLRSYRYVFKLSAENLSQEVAGKLVVEVTGEFAAPDRSHVTVNASVGGLSVVEESITIGSRSWVKQGNVWTEGTPSFGSAGFTPSDLFADFKSADLQGLQSRKERVNNIAAVRYTFDRASLEALTNLNSILGGTAASGRAGSLPQNISGDVWVAENGGYPVKITLSLSGLPPSGGNAAPAVGRSSIDLAYDLTDVDSPAIRIDQPR
jgi:hypothetical protein